MWNDEFDGSTINPNHWTFETGNNNGWGNSELEYYTGRSQNAYVAGGFLNIVSQKEAYSGYNYTSARMKSQDLFARTYGRFEFRAKLPLGGGFWSALWLLGSDIGSVGWPACGEIDIMENKGSVPGQEQGTIHYSDPANHHLQSTAVYNFAANNGATNFHTYLLEWLTNSIRWSVDGQLYETQTNWSSSTGPYPDPFDKPFFIIMNLAVGGNYLGNPSTNTINGNTVFPGAMVVDYVRVYDFTAPMRLSIGKAGGNYVLSWPSNIVCHLQAQTNSLGLTTNWFDMPGAANPFIVPLTPLNSSVFYRLQSP